MSAKQFSVQLFMGSTMADILSQINNIQYRAPIDYWKLGVHVFR